MIHIDTTIAAPATIPGTGAISIVRISGPDALQLVDRVVRFRNGKAAFSDGYSLKYGSIDGLDDVLVSIFRAPHSYTGEDAAEISCHASAYIVEQIMLRLADAGAVPAEAGEFTRRAFINGRMDLSQAEAVADLIASSNEASHLVAFNQLKGGISKELSTLRSQLIDVTSLMELELDFSEEDVTFADRTQLVGLIDSALGHIKSLTETFRLGNAIRQGVPVVIVGAANTGKSTLLNALLGENRAIVSPVAGTTRDTIEETFNIDGTLFRFVDTAGIRESDDEVEAAGIERTFAKILLADSVIAVFDARASLDVISTSFRSVVSNLNLERQHLVIAINKIDLFESSSQREMMVNKIVSILNNIVSFVDNKIDTVAISAKENLGVDKLKKCLSEHQKARISDLGTATLVSNARHYNALCASSKALSLARSGILANTPADLVSQDLREALYHLGTITGEITTDEVLGRIFDRFCIGK